MAESPNCIWVVHLFCRKTKCSMTAYQVVGLVSTVVRERSQMFAGQAVRAKYPGHKATSASRRPKRRCPSGLGFVCCLLSAASIISYFLQTSFHSLTSGRVSCVFCRTCRHRLSRGTTGEFFALRNTTCLFCSFWPRVGRMEGRRGPLW